MTVTLTVVCLIITTLLDLNFSVAVTVLVDFLSQKSSIQLLDAGGAFSKPSIDGTPGILDGHPGSQGKRPPAGLEPLATSCSKHLSLHPSKRAAVTSCACPPLGLHSFHPSNFRQVGPPGRAQLTSLRLAP